MICDAKTNFRRYFNVQAFEAAFAFAESLAPEQAPGRLNLPCLGLYAMLFDYETLDFNLAIPELHKRYVDVQIMLKGAELHAFYREGELEPQGDYNEERDIALFLPPSPASRRYLVREGDFAVYFPCETHMTKGTPGGEPQKVRKLVIKIPFELLEPDKATI